MHRRHRLFRLSLATLLVLLLMKVSSSFKLEGDPFGHYQKDPFSEDYGLIITDEEYPLEQAATAE